MKNDTATEMTTDELDDDDDAGISVRCLF